MFIKAGKHINSEESELVRLQTDEIETVGNLLYQFTA